MPIQFTRHTKPAGDQSYSTFALEVRDISPKDKDLLLRNVKNRILPLLEEAYDVYQQVFGAGESSRPIPVTLDGKVPTFAFDMNKGEILVPSSLMWESVTQKRENRNRSTVFHEAFHLTQYLLGWKASSRMEDLYWILEGQATWAQARFAFPFEKGYTLLAADKFSWLAQEFQDWNRGARTEGLPRLAPGYRPRPSAASSGYAALPFWMFLEHTYEDQLVEFVKTGAPESIQTPIASSFSRCFGKPLEALVVEFLSTVAANGFTKIRATALDQPTVVAPALSTGIPNARDTPYALGAGQFYLSSIEASTDGELKNTILIRSTFGMDGEYEYQVARPRAPAYFAVINAPLQSPANPQIGELSKPPYIVPPSPLDHHTHVANLGNRAIAIISGFQGFHPEQERTLNGKDWEFGVSVSERLQPYQIQNTYSGRYLESKDREGNDVQQWDRSTDIWTFWYDGKEGEVIHFQTNRYLCLVDGKVQLVDPVPGRTLAGMVRWSSKFLVTDGRARIGILGPDNGARPVEWRAETVAEWIAVPGDPGSTQYKRDARKVYFQLFNLSSKTCLTYQNGNWYAGLQLGGPTPPSSFWFEDGDGAVCNADSGVQLSVVDRVVMMSNSQTAGRVRLIATREELVTFDGLYRLQMLDGKSSGSPSVTGDVWSVVTGAQPNQSKFDPGL